MCIPHDLHISCTALAPTVAAAVNVGTWAVEVPEEYSDVDGDDEYSSDDGKQYAGYCGADMMSTDAACDDAPLFPLRDDTADHEESENEAENEVLTASDSPEVELYNSGTSRTYLPSIAGSPPINPSHHVQSSWRTSESPSLLGTGDMKINIPNGNQITPIMLKDMLHAPDIGSTVTVSPHHKGQIYSLFLGGELQDKEQAGSDDR
ncbi:hypothetical protein BJV74DRAFT_952203 [Russula compacta]|nr:hypothetical protein BJV74DRAFT_952203 [Russula compacta]